MWPFKSHWKKKYTLEELKEEHDKCHYAIRRLLDIFGMKYDPSRTVVWNIERVTQQEIIRTNQNPEDLTHPNYLPPEDNPSLTPPARYHGVRQPVSRAQAIEDRRTLAGIAGIIGDYWKHFFSGEISDGVVDIKIPRGGDPILDDYFLRASEETAPFGHGRKYIFTKIIKEMRSKTEIAMRLEVTFTPDFPPAVEDDDE